MFKRRYSLCRRSIAPSHSFGRKEWDILHLLVNISLSLLPHNLDNIVEQNLFTSLLLLSFLGSNACNAPPIFLGGAPDESPRRGLLFVLGRLSLIV